MAGLWLSAVLVLTTLQVFPSEATAGCKLDIGFILDGSGSIMRWGFSKEVDFVKKIVSKLDVSNANSHASVMVFADSARMINYFKDTKGQSKQHFYAAMNSIQFQGGGTNTEAALNLARTHMFASSYGARSNCQKVIIVFTDGKSSSGVTRVRTAAQKLKDLKINMISIGVGSSISSSELHAMASSPTSNHVFTVSSANALDQIVSKVQTEICRVTNCWQANCQYNSWSPWSSPCGQASRKRTLGRKQFAMKKSIGGCAGYSTSCAQTTESKDLGSCNCKLDIGFVLDESGSIESSGFKQELHFVKNIAKELSVSTANTHVSVMTFSSSAHMRNYFKDAYGQSQYQLERLINSIGYRGGGTDTERALNLARTNMFQASYGARSGVSKVIVVFTDGKSASGVARVRAAAQKLKDMGINMISIGVGSSISTDELHAMSSSSAHVFRVSSASILSSIVSRVKTESCKTFTCAYVECTYGQWGAWSKSCGDATRQRQQTKIVWKTKQAVGGCAGLAKTCNKKEEQKNLGVCLHNCRYAECSWGSWGSFSTSCGYGYRSRTTATTFKYTKRASCSGLAQSCRSNKQYSVRNIDCSCNSVSCTWGSWGSWSTTCGYGKRSRKLVAQKKTIMRKSCSGLPQTCSTNPNYNTRQAYCSCPYVSCSWGTWGAWSTTCGSGVRTRKYVAAKKTISRTSCSGLPQSCSTSTNSNQRRTYCSCPYVSCSWGSWGTWSTTCGSGVRSRKYIATKKTISRHSCLGLPQSCSTTSYPNHRKISCSCPYVSCSWGSWSAWSTTCGAGARSRKLSPTKRTTRRHDCSGLPQTCSSKPQSANRIAKCTCNYVQCKIGSWGAWSTSCGAGMRNRKVEPIKKTVQRTSCSGLRTSCASIKTSETRSTHCTCKYVECNYGAWSAWTTTCGAGERARKMLATPKTAQRANCDGLPKKCSTALDIDKRTKLCTCNYVECNYGQWSAWTTTCGEGERSRKMVTTSKTAQRANCNGLPVKCSTALDKDKRTKLCTCNYVECNYGPWSVWTTTCGDGERSRKMVATSKTAQRANCDGLPTKCSTALDMDKRTKLCTCNYVECNYGQWSAWTTTCGDGERSRKMVATSKTAQRANCDGLLTKCSTDLDMDKRTKLCTCNYVECNYGQWSAWTTTCGDGERSRKMVATSKTAQRANCDGLLTKCSTAVDMDKRTKLCTCNYVECNYGQWSAWTTTCGDGERSRKMVATSKTAQKANCDGLPTKCSTAVDMDKRTKLCTCNYVECNYGPWSAWTTSCGAGERTRKMVASKKTAQKASCTGLPQSCSTAYDVDKRTTLCTCNYVECNYGPWSNWTTTCGEGERTRKLVATPKTIQKESCAGLQTNCNGSDDVANRKINCQCKTVRCQPSQWSQWSATCGKATRTIQIISIPVTLQAPSCDNLPTKCAKSVETQQRETDCGTDPNKGANPTCSVKFKSHGCYKDDMKDPRPMPELVMTERDSYHHAWNGKLIDWDNWDSYMMQLICRCAEKAKSKKYTFFGLQFYGECWSGPEAGGTYNRNGLAIPGSCIKEKYAPCLASDKYCIGQKETNFVYQITP